MFRWLCKLNKFCDVILHFKWLWDKGSFNWDVLAYTAKRFEMPIKNTKAGHTYVVIICFQMRVDDVTSGLLAFN